MAEDAINKGKRIIESLESSKGNYGEVKQGINTVRAGLDEIYRNVEEMESGVTKSLEIYKHIPAQAWHLPSPDFSVVVASGEIVSRQVYLHSERLKHALTQTAKATTYALEGSSTGTTASANMTSIAFKTGASSLKNFPGSTGLIQAVEKARIPDPVKERREFSQKLKAMEPRLYDKFEGMWQTLTDATKKDRFRQSAHSMREIVSDLLEILSPDEEVKEAKWWKTETRNGKPSQKQRVKYAIIGLKEQSSFPDKEINLVEGLMNEARDRYEKLNDIAHARKKESEKLFPLLESSLMAYQRILNDILKLREKHFTKNPI